MENGSIVQTFAKGFNPLVDGAWTLVPIRKVVDAIDARQGYEELNFLLSFQSFNLKFDINFEKR